MMYTVKNFNTAREFVDYNEEFIYSNPMQNVLLINVIEEVAKNNLRVFQAFNVIGNSSVKLLVLVTDGYCLIYCDHYDAGYLEIIRKELPFERLKYFIFSGDKQTIERLLELQDLQFTVEKHLTIYKCAKLNSQFKLASGKMRLAIISELDYLTKLSVEFTEEYDGNRENAAEMRMAVYSEILDNSLYLWEDGKICAIALEMNRMDFPEIGKLYTVQDERQKRYSSSLLYKITEKILSKKPFCMLYTHGENPASNATVLKVGYEKTGDYARITLKN
jgi:hypothetical protein